MCKLLFCKFTPDSAIARANRSRPEKIAEAAAVFVEGYKVYKTLKDVERAREIKKKLFDLYAAWGKPEKAALYKTP